MEKLTFKNYPSRILVGIICVIIALNFFINVLIKSVSHQETSTLKQTLGIATCTGLVVLIMSWINKKGMWKWYLQLLGHCDIRGVYAGKIVSSYHEQDNPAFPRTQLYCRLKIVQNLNGFHVDGAFYTDAHYQEKSSEFFSSAEVLQKKENGLFQVHYFYYNKGALLHSDHQQYGLNNHLGICVLQFDPATRALTGYYFNHDRSSHGTIAVSPATSV